MSDAVNDILMNTVSTVRSTLCDKLRGLRQRETGRGSVSLGCLCAGELRCYLKRGGQRREVLERLILLKLWQTKSDNVKFGKPGAVPPLLPRENHNVCCCNQYCDFKILIHAVQRAILSLWFCLILV